MSSLIFSQNKNKELNFKLLFVIVMISAIRVNMFSVFIVIQQVKTVNIP